MLIFLLYNIWQKVYASAFLGRDVNAILTENKEHSLCNGGIM